MRYKLGLCLLVCMMLLGCHKKDSSSSIRLLLDWLPNPNHIPLVVAVESGFFEEEEIHLEILKLVDPPSAIPYLQSGQAEVVINYAPYIFTAMSRDKSLEIVGTLIEEPLDGISYLSEKEESSLLDLQGKSLALHPGPFFSYLKGALEARGLTSCSLTKLKIDPIVALMTSISDGVGGVYWNVEPHLLKFLGKKNCFIRVTDLGVPKYPELMFVARKEFIQRNPKIIKRFQRALQKGIEFCQKDPEKAFELYLDKYPHKKALTAKWEKDAWLETVSLFAKDQRLDNKNIWEFIQWMEGNGFFEKGKIKKEELFSGEDRA